jgi:hypothetical protein
MNSRYREVPNGVVGVEMFVAPEPLGQVSFAHAVDSGLVEGLMARLREPISLAWPATSEMSASCPLRSARFHPDSVTLLQSTPDNPGSGGMEFELALNGMARIRTILNPVGVLGHFLPEKLASPVARQALYEIVGHSGERNGLVAPRSATLMDVGDAMFGIAALMALYLELAREDIWSQRVRLGWRVFTTTDVGMRPIAFSDTDAWGRHVLRFGLPFITRQEYAVERPASTVADLSDEPLWFSCLAYVGMMLGLGESVSAILSDEFVKRVEGA